MGDMPHWMEAGLAAVLGFVASYAALRSVVGQLKEELKDLRAVVAEFRALVTSVAMLQAAVRTLEMDLERMRTMTGDTGNRMHDLSERITRMEVRAEES